MRPLLLAVLLLVASATTQANSDKELVNCDVFIGGGSIAALAAALASASAGAKTCLTEPSDWVGGQLTNEVLPAIDFAWASVTTGNDTLDVPALERDPANLPKNFVELWNAMGDPGACSVSIACFPVEKVRRQIAGMVAALNATLTVWTNTVIKSVGTAANSDGGQALRVTSVTAIQRVPSDGAEWCGGWDVPLSQQIDEWYSAAPTRRYPVKRLVKFTAAVYVEATSWGELLALSGVPTLLGLSERYDGDTSGVGDDQCGQSSTVDFVEQMSAAPVTSEPTLPPPPPSIESRYGLGSFSWQYVWRYRRSLAAGAADVQAGDVTVQNWGYGNDNRFAYVFLSRADAAAAAAAHSWTGGLNITALAVGEATAFGWHQWFRRNAPAPFLNCTVLVRDPSVGAGTCTGLSKLVYLRDSRRAIGLGDWVLSMKDLTGPAQQTVAVPPPDRVAIGNYDVDIHPIIGCSYPPYMTDQQYSVLPYYVPYRALTHANLSNVVVSGLSIAQSFLASSTTRTHPVQWAVGTASGVSAAFQSSRAISSTAAVLSDHIAELQQQIVQYQPISWTVNGRLIPSE